jgi:prepilin-type N-terminal cleavage/methylation domain-containing protein/prepilin-type processing-associated H-X9-DG protein
MRRGFTLIELLVVIAIISILASMIFPVFSKAREKAHEITCISNLSQLAKDMQMRVMDNDGAFPASGAIWTDMTGDRRILQCPTEGKEVANAFLYSGYVAGKAEGDIKFSVDEPLFLDGYPGERTTNGITEENMLREPGDIDYRHGGRLRFNCVFCDGHAASLDEPPPMWIVVVSQPWEFDEEVFRTHFPSIVLFYSPSGTDGEPEYEYCQRVLREVPRLAGAYRLHAKLVLVNGEDFPDLVTRAGITPGDQDLGYPTFVIYDGRREVGRVSGFPPDITDWTEDDWRQEIDLCRQQVDDLARPLIRY